MTWLGTGKPEPKVWHPGEVACTKTRKRKQRGQHATCLVARVRSGIDRRQNNSIEPPRATARCPSAQPLPQPKNWLNTEEKPVSESKQPLSELLRPQQLDDLTFPQSTIDRLQRMIDSKNIMNMLFYGKPGLENIRGTSVRSHPRHRRNRNHRRCVSERRFGASQSPTFRCEHIHVRWPKNMLHR